MAKQTVQLSSYQVEQAIEAYLEEHNLFKGRGNPKATFKLNWIVDSTEGAPAIVATLETPEPR